MNCENFVTRDELERLLNNFRNNLSPVLGGLGGELSPANKGWIEGLLGAVVGALAAKQQADKEMIQKLGEQLINSQAKQQEQAAKQKQQNDLLYKQQKELNNLKRALGGDYSGDAPLSGNLADDLWKYKNKANQELARQQREFEQQQQQQQKKNLTIEEQIAQTNQKVDRLNAEIARTNANVRVTNDNFKVIQQDIVATLAIMKAQIKATNDNFKVIQQDTIATLAMVNTYAHNLQDNIITLQAKAKEQATLLNLINLRFNALIVDFNTKTNNFETQVRSIRVEQDIRRLKEIRNGSDIAALQAAQQAMRDQNNAALQNYKREVTGILNEPKEQVNNLNKKVVSLEEQAGLKLDKLGEQIRKNHQEANNRALLFDTEVAKLNEKIAKELGSAGQSIKDASESISKKLKDASDSVSDKLRIEFNGKIADSVLPLNTVVNNIPSIQAQVNTNTNTLEQIKAKTTGLDTDMTTFTTNINDKINTANTNIGVLNNTITKNHLTEQQAIDEALDLLKGMVIPSLIGLGALSLPNIATAVKTATCEVIQSSQCLGGIRGATARGVNDALQTAGLGGIAAQNVATQGQIAALQASMLTNFGDLFKSRLIDRTMAMVNFGLEVHNGMMLSRDLVQSCGQIIDNIVATTKLIKNEKGEQKTVSEILGTTVKTFLVNVVGETSYKELQLAFTSLSTVLNSAAQVRDNVYQIGQGLSNIVENSTQLVGHQTEQILDQLGDDSSNRIWNDWDNLNYGVHTGKMTKILYGAQEVVSVIEMMSNDIRSIAENAVETQKNVKEFQDNSKKATEALTKIKVDEIIASVYTHAVEWDDLLPAPTE